MYPAFPHVLRTIQQNLIREVIPDLSTDYAREQATGLLLLIEHLLSRWDRAAEALREENQDLRDTLRQIDEQTGNAAATDALGEAQRAAGPGEALLAENTRLRARLASAIETAPEGSATLRLAEGFMARQLGRERAAVAVGELTWD